MEISGRILREVEFRDRLRGYDTDEVDEFLEKVAVGVDELHAAIAKVRAELVEASQRTADAPVEEVTFSDDAIRRTLVLAQRTADLAIKEAEEEGRRTLEEARERAQSLIARAEDDAQRARAAAAADLQSRVDELTDQRDLLEREVTSLTDLVERERERLGDALSSALRMVNDTLAVSEQLRETASATTLRPSAPAAAPTPAAAVEDDEDDEDDNDLEDLTAATESGRVPRFNFADDLDVDIDDDSGPPAPISDVLSNGHGIAEAHTSGASLVDDDEELWERWAKGSPLEAGDLPGTEDPFGPDRRGRTTS